MRFARKHDIVLCNLPVTNCLLTRDIVFTNFFFRPDTLDPALLRPGRLDRKVEFGLPDLESRTQIFKIHTRTMNCERDIRFELLARLCPNSTGEKSFSVHKYNYHFCKLWLYCCIFGFFELRCCVVHWFSNTLSCRS